MSGFHERVRLLSPCPGAGACHIAISARLRDFGVVFQQQFGDFYFDHSSKDGGRTLCHKRQVFLLKFKNFKSSIPPPCFYTPPPQQPDATQLRTHGVSPLRLEAYLTFPPQGLKNLTEAIPIRVEFFKNFRRYVERSYSTLSNKSHQ